ncbi:SpoIVB peptidase [Sulfobacillus harzensis]|uniref:SpoIVB peptidase n=1 Tax=Sulfobacillus harzensis TaxID=2729629 RepID=A0A7Y0L0N2_9FIRM|nr:SpoIVB peptidase [Sulfobacillus harzensis]NMP21141.1 SpoIVB peptidase [Sulfobacillus harzensis]
MKRGRISRALGIVLASGVVALGTSAPARALFNFPAHLEIPQGQGVRVSWSRFVPVAVASGNSRPVMVANASQIDVETPSSGHYLLHFRLFGWLPWRGVPVDVPKPAYVVPGGESVGVLVHTRGLIVNGFSPVRTQGRVVDPAQEAGLERGDVIASVDAQPAKSVAFLEQRVNQDGIRHQPVRLRVAGARSERVRTVMPVWSERLHHWQIGVTLQDRTSGVGTLTFYNPKTLAFTALGHSMTDGLTRRPVGVQAGRAMGADIVGVVPAADNHPGQKVGVLAGPANVSGSVDANGTLGIVGRLDHQPLWGPHRALPLALPDQVHPGPATIITVLRGQIPERYHIEILKTAAQSQPDTKGLLFRVTDPGLLHKTGGVVQGMSGSPIIQNGRVVGAVTHVLISRPALGFGCYAYWMERQSAYQHPS